MFVVLQEGGKIIGRVYCFRIGDARTKILVSLRYEKKE